MSLERFLYDYPQVRWGVIGSAVAAGPWMIMNHFYRPYPICYHTGDFGITCLGGMMLYDLVNDLDPHGASRHWPEVSASLVTVAVALTELVHTGVNVPDVKDIPAAILGGVVAYLWTKGKHVEEYGIGESQSE